VDRLTHKELRDISSKLYNPADMLQVIQNFLNIGGDTRMRLYLRGHERYVEPGERPLYDWHPTLQQCLMRGFIAPAIRVLGEVPHPDDRNYSTVEACKKVSPILEEYSFPFI